MSEYYQVALTSQLFRYRNYDKKAAVADLFQTSHDPLRLVLGLKENGGVFLLAPKDVVTKVLRTWHPHDIVPAGAFKSLSPTVFQSGDTLVKKLQKLSAGNKKYHSGTDGSQRVMFEHNRMLLRVLDNEVEDPSGYSLTRQHLAKIKSLRFVSFSFKKFYKENRVYDVGYSISKVGEWTPFASYHFNLKEAKDLFDRARGRFMYGTTETLDNACVQLRLAMLFSGAESLVLLVCDANHALEYLADCGIDTSKWQIGVQSLFNYRLPGHNDSDILSTPQVYVVDVRVLCNALFASHQNSESVRKMARFKFRLPAPEGEDEDICAGNDSRLLFDVWHEMASGNAIDEQRAERAQSSLQPVPALQESEELHEEEEEEGEVDDDPNDVIPATRSPKPVGPKPSNDEELSDYASSDSDG